jgi:hypothetical protein
MNMADGEWRKPERKDWRVLIASLLTFDVFSTQSFRGSGVDMTGKNVHMSLLLSRIPTASMKILHHRS